MTLKGRAVIFDMDGVIIDSEPLHAQVKAETLSHFHLPYDDALLAAYVGRTSDDLFRGLIERAGRTDLEAEEVTRYKHDHYLAALEAGEIPRVPGALELIRRLHGAGVPLALATSSWEPVMDAVLDGLGIRACFRSALSGATLPRSKPDPLIYRLSAERLGVAPRDCVVIEDSTSGILAAHRAGMHVAAYRNPHSGAQDLSLADEVLTDYRDFAFTLEHAADVGSGA